MHNKGHMNVCMSVTERNTLWVVGHVTRFLTFYINGMKRKNTVQMFAVLVLEETMEDMEDTEAMGICFLSSFPFPPHISLAPTQREHNALRRMGWPSKPEQWSLSTYHSELVRCRAMLEQDVDDVGVPLLCSLVQRRVPVLQAQGKGEAALGTARLSPPQNNWGRGRKLTFVLALTFAECCRRKLTIFMFP